MSALFKMNDGVKATLIGAGANLVLSLVKFIGGLIGNSTALIADAVHSLSDLITDGVVLLTHQVGRMPADPEHPYGHGRAETIGETIVGAVIIAAGAGIAYEVWAIIQAGTERVPGILAAAGAGVSILVNEALYRYQLAIGEKAASPSLVANAWHHRTDAISSIAALAGIVGAMLGYPVLDPIAGGLVALMIVKVGIDITRGGVKDLMDTAVEEEKTAEFQKILEGIPEVIRHHDLRTRKIGGEIFMDVHILVDPDLTVTEGHKIAELVRRQMINTFAGVQDVLVHVDGEDDSVVEPLYPVTRQELKERILPILKDEELKMIGLRVHHMRGRNIVDIFLRTGGKISLAETESRFKALKKRLAKLPGIDHVRLYLDFGLNGD
ncbi:MAG: cation transporter [Nitrospinaceae bacterium]|nr:MAG: cation transporter [Nitrospinaceae bacterium]